MLIRLIAPEYRSYAGTKETETLSQRKLTLIYLAALTPSEFDVEIIDGDINEIIYDDKPDLIGISFNSVTMNQAYEIADKYKSIGKTVVMGGFHASLFPEEALEHSDAVVVGEAEIQWKILLNDFKNRKLQKIYKNDKPVELKNLPIPRYDLYKKSDYFKQIPLFITRGCPYKCNFCCIRAVYGHTFRKRPIDDVIEQIKYIKDNYDDSSPIPLSFSFVDDNIWGDKKYAEELFKKLIPLKINWYVQGAILNLESDLLNLASESGCSLVFIGFESLIKENLNYLNKSQNEVEKYKEFIEKLHLANIAIGAYFIVGLPFDTNDLFKEIYNFMEENYIELPMIMLYNIIPGTETYEKSGFEKLGYNYMIENLPLFTPKGMDKKEFRKEFVDFHRRIFSDQSIDNRLKKSRNIAMKFINKGHQNYFKNNKWDDWIIKAENLETLNIN